MNLYKMTPLTRAWMRKQICNSVTLLCCVSIELLTPELNAAPLISNGTVASQLSEGICAETQVKIGLVQLSAQSSQLK